LESVPDYPWGLRISLSERELAKLGLPADCAVGDQISFDCCARVCSVSLNDSESGASARVELQITEMAVDEDDSEEAMADPQDRGAPKAYTVLGKSFHDGRLYRGGEVIMLYDDEVGSAPRRDRAEKPEVPQAQPVPVPVRPSASGCAR
jgi:hypothetical protein